MTVAHWVVPYFLLHHWRSCLLLMCQTSKHCLIVSYSSRQITLWNFFLHTKANMTSCLCWPLLPTLTANWDLWNRVCWLLNHVWPKPMENTWENKNYEISRYQAYYGALSHTKAGILVLKNWLDSHSFWYGLFVEGNKWCISTIYKVRHTTTTFYMKKAVEMYLFINIISKRNSYIKDLGCYRGILFLIGPILYPF